jgi:cyclic pyranopterin phosphate synthase
MSKFSHLSSSGDARMVDVSAKEVSNRVAKAQGEVILGEVIMAELEKNDFQSKKGSIIQTAIIAANMAVKNTANLIPLCHPLLINGCIVEIDKMNKGALRILCEVKVSGKTGVEMEALTGVSVAALTIYDMCKSMSHEIRIANIHLVKKTGGKSDYAK